MILRPLLAALVLLACSDSPTRPHAGVPYTIAIAGSPCIKLRFIIQPYEGTDILVRDSILAGDSVTVTLPETGVYSGSGEMDVDSIGIVPGWWNVYAPGAIHFACQ